ncbi:MAG TPA: hypothetical protein VIX12_02850 [Candidatus Binataceae bacterium]
MADDATNRIGAMLEELGTRFELVVEAVSGFGGRLDSLREELFAQFAEVGGQIRFLSEQIAENRRGIVAMRADLGAEMVRLGEALGKTRVEFREQIAAPDGSAVQPAANGTSRDRLAASHAELSRDFAETAKSLKREIAASPDLIAKKLGAELKHTNKALATLAHKFDRFDDRITIETRDHDQRLKKLERKTRTG